MFRLAKRTAAAIDAQVAAACRFPPRKPQFLASRSGLKGRLPFLFAHDRSESHIGNGEPGFSAAKHAFAQWEMFNLGWTRVANPSAAIVPGEIVVVEAHTLGLWTLNCSQIIEVIETPESFGFIYGTTALHVEQGEERFLIVFDSYSGRVTYELEAVSRPRSILARLGFPVSRAFQHKFARESHQIMRKAVSSSVV